MSRAVATAVEDAGPPGGASAESEAPAAAPSGEEMATAPRRVPAARSARRSLRDAVISAEPGALAASASNDAGADPAGGAAFDGPDLDEGDLAGLRRAVRTLEHPGLAARLSAAAGAPLDMVGRALPSAVTDAVSRAAETALRTALKVALATLPGRRVVPGAADAAFDVADTTAEEAPDPAPPSDGAAAREEDPAASGAASGAPSRRLPALPRVDRLPATVGALVGGDLAHKALAIVSGALGGAFGLASAAAELPVSTTIMLRSIAEIARAEGEDLADPEAALACIQVFALGGRGRDEGPREAAESAYFAVRAALARTTAEAARYVATHGVVGEGAPALVRFASQVAARFGLVVSQKLAAGAVPVLGALGGATANAVFMDHFQGVARAHFTVRRLERRYGAGAVRAAYDAERRALG